MSITPEDVYRRAARAIAHGQRLEVNALIDELHVSRATLFRKAGNREQILGEAIWWMAEHSLGGASARWRRAYGGAVRDGTGTLRCVRIITDHGAAVAADRGVRRLLDEEPKLTMRVLTDPFGAVQPRMIVRVQQLIADDVRAAALQPSVALDDLSYAVVRLGESMLYADILAGRKPNIENANTLVGALITGVLSAR
ncbi:QsdR family transcriptional regulator [Nocardia cyriacigeorgica]|uniref:QsdR family transcriptional regulator n=1 Tax=Nocardia cyriacigeorgica TaxID=135487 RepID=UPI002454A03F|nr:QsdR family transcriptional regulator [Nocardia cyriacigeorgica]